MPATYRSAPRRTLKHGDQVIFVADGREIRYVTCSKQLENPHGPNCLVFDLLKLNRGDIVDEAYGYSVDHSSGWPEANNRDYPALTRLVRVLFAKIKEHNTRPTAKEYCRRRRLPSRFADVVEFFRRNNFGCQTQAAQKLMEAYFSCGVEIADIITGTRASK